MSDSIRLLGRNAYADHTGSDFIFLGEKKVRKWWKRSKSIAQYVKVAHLLCNGTHIFVAGGNHMNVRIDFDGTDFDVTHWTEKKAERICYSPTEAIGKDFVDCFFSNFRVYTCRKAGQGIMQPAGVKPTAPSNPATPPPNPATPPPKSATPNPKIVDFPADVVVNRNSTYLAPAASADVASWKAQIDQLGINHFANAKGMLGKMIFNKFAIILSTATALGENLKVKPFPPAIDWKGHKPWPLKRDESYVYFSYDKDILPTLAQVKAGHGYSFEFDGTSSDWTQGMDTTYAHNSFEHRYIFAVFCYVNPDNPLEHHYEFTDLTYTFFDHPAPGVHATYPLDPDIVDFIKSVYQKDLDARGKTQGTIVHT